MFRLLRQEWGDGTQQQQQQQHQHHHQWIAPSQGRSIVVASSFDAFVDAVLEALPRLDLPVVTGEPGWAGLDPRLPWPCDVVGIVPCQP